MSAPRILHTVIALTSQTQLVLWPWVIFSGTNRKNNYCFIYYLNILKIYQRETSYFELSRDMNSDDFSKRINDVTLQWLRCNSFVAMIFVFLFHRCLQTKQPLQAQSLLWPWAVFPDTYRKNTYCCVSNKKKSFFKKSMPGLCLRFQYSYQTFWTFWMHDLQSLHRQNLVVLISSLYFSKLVKTSHFLVLQAVRASFYVRYRLCPNKCHSHDSWEKMDKTP